MQDRTGIAAFSRLIELDPPPLQTYTKAMEKLFKILEFDGFVQIVEMPGIITATNSSELKGSRVEWNVNADSFLVKANSMVVESRVVNYWAFVLTSIVLLLLIIILLMKGFRK